MTTMNQAQARMLAVTAGLLGVSPLVVWPFAGFQVAVMLAESYALTLAILLLCMLWARWFETLGRNPLIKQRERFLEMKS